MRTRKLMTLTILAATLTGLTAAHGSAKPGHHSEEISNSKIAEGIISHNFIINGRHALPVKKDAKDLEEKTSPEKFEAEAKNEEKQERDNNNSITVSKKEAKKTAIAEFGDHWYLANSKTDEAEGYYEFEFKLNSSKATGSAEIRVDGSTGKIFRIEKEVETEDEKEEKKAVGTSKGSVSLRGFIGFETEGYEVETEVEKNENNIDFTVKIKSPSESSNSTKDISKKEIEESIEVEPGTYKTKLEVFLDSEKVHTESEKVRIKKIPAGEPPVNVPLPEEKREEESEEELQKMTKKELIEQIQELKEEIRELRKELETTEEEEHQKHEEKNIDEQRKERFKERKEEELEENQSREEDKTETEVEAEVEKESGNQESSAEVKAEVEKERQSGENRKQKKEKAKSKRPGFVEGLLSSLFK